ncbi:MAG: hydantoinase/oxoprolinase family protein [Alphaproteobacteria bacterium]|nr:hydantoinase/oxoprolinase family protein [Alphaproteobacteria bacterium]
MRARPSARLAADIGGTFTDVVVEWDDRKASAKILTTVDAPERGVIQGIQQLMAELDLAPDDVGVVIHGTTLATNALIEQKGAKTAFVTTEGVGDLLDMGFEKRYAHYDLFQERPPALVPSELRFEVPERIAADGDVLKPLDEDAVRLIAVRLASLGAEAVAIGFLHAYAHADHEKQTEAILKAHLADVTICLSSEVCPEIREYERFSTTVANAYVRPLMAGYLERLAGLLEGIGIKAPLYVMMSGGGITTLDQACRLPIRLIESGPAGGAILAANLAREMGEDEVMAFDMGGTTAKVCLITSGAPDRSRRFEVARVYRDLKGSGLPLRIPVIDMVEIGAGGGSIGRVDRLGRITMGPDSAGADPGPAAYNRGGVCATVTDANLVISRIDPERFAGGAIPLKPDLAKQAIQRDVGDALGAESRWAAAGMIEIVDENMANAARVHAIERGKVIGRHSMIAFGGSAPLHAARLADKLGMNRVIVPSDAGVGSAIGFLRAPLSYEVVRSRRMALAVFDAAEANRLLDEMTSEAMAVVEPGMGEGLNVDPPKRHLSVDMRYIGQGHELTISLQDRPLGVADATLIKADFEQRYQSIYGVVLDHVGIEITAWSLTISASTATGGRVTPVVAAATVEPASSRDVYDPGLGDMVSYKLCRRSDLRPGSVVDGPAIIAEDQTSTVVPKGWRAHIADNLAIVLDRAGENQP